VLFLGAALACLWVRYERQPVPHEPVSAQTLLAGVRYVWGHPVLLGAVSLDLFAVLLGGATALLPIFAKEILHVGPEGLGLLRSAPAVGALAAGLVLSHVALERRVGPKLLVSVAVFGLCMVVFGLSTSFWLSLLALAVSGAADMVSVVIRQTLVQLETPDQMRGRVAAVNTLFIGASNQLGEFESGVTAAAFGPVGSVVLGGLGTIGISLAWWRLFRPLAMRDALAGPQRVA
jgi:MFS family permease